MKCLLVAGLALTTLCLPSLAQKKGADDFNDLIKRYYSAWNTLNPDNASFLYARDADLVFFDIAPLKYSGGWQNTATTSRRMSRRVFPVSCSRPAMI